MKQIDPLNIEPADVFANMPTKKLDWIWDSQMARGCLTLLVGPPKSGKSLFVRNLMRCISLGEPLLGFETKKCSAIYLALEEHPSFLQDEIKMTGTDTDSLHIHVGPVLSKNTETLLEFIKEYCDTHQTGLLVIDPMVKFVSFVDTNDYSQSYTKLNPIIEFARANDIHVILLHHSNKGGSDTANQILGSTGIFGVSDGAFLLSRSGDTCSLSSNLRYGANLEKVLFRYDKNKLLCFQGTSQEVRLHTLLAEILEFIKFGPSTIIDIQREVKAAKSTILKALEDLIMADQIVRLGSGKKSDEFKYAVLPLETTGKEQNAAVGL